MEGDGPWGPYNVREMKNANIRKGPGYSGKRRVKEVFLLVHEPLDCYGGAGQKSKKTVRHSAGRKPATGLLNAFEPYCTLKRNHPQKGCCGRQGSPRGKTGPSKVTVESLGWKLGGGAGPRSSATRLKEKFHRLRGSQMTGVEGGPVPKKKPNRSWPVSAEMSAVHDEGRISWPGKSKQEPASRIVLKVTCGQLTRGTQKQSRMAPGRCYIKGRCRDKTV